MDWITQALLAASLTAAWSRFYEIRLVALTGVVGGLIPYLEWLYLWTRAPGIRYDIHYGPTFSLLFIPFGALLCASIIFLVRRILESEPVRRWKEQHQPRTGSGRVLVSRQFELYRDTDVPPVGPPLIFPRLYTFSLLALLVPGLFQALHTRGSHLLWPVNADAVAWSVFHRFDPLIFLLLAAGLIGALWIRDKKPARWGILAFLAYVALAAFQRERAESALLNHAQTEAIPVQQLLAAPTWANINLKRGLIRTPDGRIHTMAVNLPVIGRARVYPGPTFEPESTTGRFGLIRQDPAARQIRAFENACQEWVALRESGNGFDLIDLRLSPLPNSALPRAALRIEPPVRARSRFPLHKHSLEGEGQRLAFFRMWMGQDLPESD